MVMVCETKLRKPLGHVLERFCPQQVLRELLPEVPSTLRDSDVPELFREPFICSGYRPVGRAWKYYALSLFLCHNEALNVWTHLLAVLVLLARFCAFLCTAAPLPALYGLPLHCFAGACLIYLSCSVLAHLFQSKSELAHYSFYFLDYVGVGAYQYGSALAHYYYCAELDWLRVMRPFFLPAAALLGWLSCLGCCLSKMHFRRPYPTRRKLCQLVPACLAYVLDISPVVHRLAGCWAAGCADPAAVYHGLQIALFLVASAFFSCPVPERYFPGSCDIVGHAHQIFHTFLALCTLAQMEAVLLDYWGRRDVFAARGDHDSIYAACGLFALLLLGCGCSVLYLRHVLQRQLRKRSD
ncbi:membrane progestin receptor beta [Hemitrygon akajei]|uniref:membrane progestin receptor beta n=1 Tax=Hemitrygon akajei TaxID=2704970 RepID=UPI003BF954C4